MSRLKPAKHRIRFVGGPHHGRTVTYSDTPAALVMLDDHWCYHEYARTRGPGVITRYRWRARLGRPSWAPPLPADEGRPA